MEGRDEDEQEEYGSSRKGKPQTAWHPLFADVLSFFLPTDYRLLSEYQLTREPQRVDIVIWEEKSRGGAFDGLPALMERLTKRNLIEFKSPVDQLERMDYSRLAAYALQYHVLEEGFRLEDLSLFVVAPSMTESFQDGLKDWKQEALEVDEGVYLLQTQPWTAWCIESDVAWKEKGNEVLGLFSKNFVKGKKIVTVLEHLLPWLYPWLVQQLAKHRERSRIMPLARKEEFERNMQQILVEYLNSLPLEERLQGLTPEERLQGLAPEERLQGLAPEELIECLEPEQRRALSRRLGEPEGLDVYLRETLSELAQQRFPRIRQRTLTRLEGLSAHQLQELLSQVLLFPNSQAFRHAITKAEKKNKNDRET